MKWKNIFSKSFGILLFVFLLLSVVAISTPFWIPCFVQFSKTTALIGETMGGISTPFITLIMALLAFSAFWMQYKTLRDQRQEMNRQHFEGRLSLMLSQLRENVNGLKAGAVHGRAAAEELAGEFYLTLTCVNNIVDNELSDDIKNASGIDDKQRAELTIYFNEIISNDQLKLIFILKTAYGIFFQGLNFTPNVSDSARELLTSLIERRLKKSSFNINPDKSFADVLYSSSKDLSEIKEVPYKPFRGHNAEMSSYYRHLYQIICFIANCPKDEISEEEKYGYAKMVRSHLSDYEQFLLYYNAMSDFGAPWNTPLVKDSKYEPENMGLIARYRLIKNIPGNINWRGYNPLDKYKKEINVWKRLQQDFFETPQFLVI